MNITTVFQSTRPLRGETYSRMRFGYVYFFSIHSPLAGRDGNGTTEQKGGYVFNPLAPCGARHTAQDGSARASLFSIHSPLAGRDKMRINELRKEPLFSIHSPLAGRDWWAILRLSCTSVFNPLAPCGARRRCALIGMFRENFQSTRPLRGETRKTHREETQGFAFSIHSPLAGRDLAW